MGSRDGYITTPFRREGVQKMNSYFNRKDLPVGWGLNRKIRRKPSSSKESGARNSMAVWLADQHG